MENTLRHGKNRHISKMYISAELQYRIYTHVFRPHDHVNTKLDVIVYNLNIFWFKTITVFLVFVKLILEEGRQPWCGVQTLQITCLYDFSSCDFE